MNSFLMRQTCPVDSLVLALKHRANWSRVILPLVGDEPRDPWNYSERTMKNSDPIECNRISRNSQSLESWMLNVSMRLKSLDGPQESRRGFRFVQSVNRYGIRVAALECAHVCWEYFALPICHTLGVGDE